MDPRKLLYLTSIIEHGSFKKAARYLRVSQPALSMSMNRLELTVGGKLLERGPMGVKPTSLGQLLYSRAKGLSDQIDPSEPRIRHVQSNGDRVLTFGMLPSLATAVIPAALCRWRATHATRRVRVVEKVPIELIIGLIEGDLDFIVGQTESYEFLEGLKQRVLFQDRLYVIARPAHPVFQMESLSWAELSQFPWANPLVDRQTTLLERLLLAEGRRLPQQLTECASIDFAKYLVCESDHLALLPAHAVAAEIKQEKIKVLNVTHPELKRHIAAIYREKIPLEEASWDLLSEIGAVGSASGIQEPPFVSEGRLPAG